MSEGFVELTIIIIVGNGNPLQYSCLENPGTEEPSGLPSMGSHRVGHDWSDLAAAAFITMVFFIGGSVVKNRLPMQETWVTSLSWEDHLEKEMASRSSILAWEIPWTEEPGWLQSMGSQRVRYDWATKQHQNKLRWCFVLYILYLSLD